MFCELGRISTAAWSTILKLTDTGKVKIGQLYQPRLSAESATTPVGPYKPKRNWLLILGATVYFVLLGWATAFVLVVWNADYIDMPKIMENAANFVQREPAELACVGDKPKIKGADIQCVDKNGRPTFFVHGK